MKFISPITNYLREHPSLGRMALKLIPDVRWTINVDPIGPYQIRLRRHRSYWLRHPLFHEGFTLGCFSRFVRPGDVVYDVGSNLGLYTRMLVTHFGASRVIGFEPMTENRELLMHNIELGGVGDRVKIYPYALGDSDHEEDLQVDDIMSGSATLNSVTQGKACVGRQQYKLGPKTEPVVVRTLDSLMKSENLPPPSVIKLDIEGAEGMMLRGALQTLKEHRPRLIVELHGIAQSREVFSVLDGAGYTVACRLFHDEKVNYTIIKQHHVDNLQVWFSMHYVVASMDPEDVREPIQMVQASQLKPATPPAAQTTSPAA